GSRGGRGGGRKCVASVGEVDRGAREQDKRSDPPLQGEQLLGVGGLEGGEVDDDVGPLADGRLESAGHVAVEGDVLDSGWQLALAAAAHNHVPASFLEPRDQSAAGLAAAAEEKSAARHRRDDSSLIFWYL